MADSVCVQFVTGAGCDIALLLKVAGDGWSQQSAEDRIDPITGEVTVLRTLRYDPPCAFHTDPNPVTQIEYARIVERGPAVSANG